ncbi:MAG: bifunctional glutamate N-acetyltransferase/amino-acid acetyltransferase ArgJ [Candidatus Latescibacterota bacterium]|nr:bifunctional glutamate N-acetyltransferase/amino-acid acetyltransferase ArgJ [Candidatus Latescibacterota bacterium]
MPKSLDQGGVTTPRGFQAAGVHAGVYSDPDRKDLALVYSESPASAAAVYTSNRVQAAPIAVDRQHLKDGLARAVILNSGNANACTGAQGLADARRMCELAGQPLGIDADEVLVCSTGLIGATLPMGAIEGAVPAVVQALSPEGGGDAAEAIMTTDTFAKSCAVELEADGVTFRVGAMAKGAAMIAPNMATMLCVVTTDAAMAPAPLKEILADAVSRTFNCITVDGDMSTNDTVLLLANGLAGTKPGSVQLRERLSNGVEWVCRHLAKAIARDGEGATKLISIRVKGAPTDLEARTVGLAVANSNLVKTAVFGRDPNWGRILCAVGYSGVDLDPDRVEVKLCGSAIYAGGAGLDVEAEALARAMEADEIPIEIDLSTGSSTAEIFTCDLTDEYVRLNAEYTT